MSDQPKQNDPNTNNQNFYYYQNVNCYAPPLHPYYPIYGYFQQPQPTFQQTDFETLLVRRAKGNDEHEQPPIYYAPQLNYIQQPYQVPTQTFQPANQQKKLVYNLIINYSSQRQSHVAQEQHEEKNNNRKGSQNYNKHEKQARKKSNQVEENKGAKEVQVHKTSPYVERKTEPLYVPKLQQPETKSHETEKLTETVKYVEKTERKGSESKANKPPIAEKKTPQQQRKQSENQNLLKPQEQTSVQKSPQQGPGSPQKAKIVLSKEQIIKAFQEMSNKIEINKQIKDLSKETLPVLQTTTFSHELEHLTPCTRRKDSRVFASPYQGPKVRKESYNKNH